jgi:Rad3-related DNA helicase
MPENNIHDNIIEGVKLYLTEYYQRYLYQQNNHILRQVVSNKTKKILTLLPEYITDYIVVCDESNNLPNHINDQLTIDIGLRLTGLPEFIFLQMGIMTDG